MEGRKGRRDRDGGYGNETKFKLKRSVTSLDPASQLKSSQVVATMTDCIAYLL